MIDRRATYNYPSAFQGIEMADTETQDPRVQAAKDFCRMASEWRSRQLKRENDDLAFQVPELQWTPEAKTLFAGGLIDGVFSPPRPMLSISKIDQPIQLILNQERSAHLGVNVHPLSEDADDDTAEVLQDIYRGIERESFADLARTWAFERGVKAGWGVYRILSEYADETKEGPGIFDQSIRIRRILDQRCALLDPFATEPDWSDGRKALIYEMLPFDRYQQAYPGSKLADFDAGDFEGLDQDLLDGWWADGGKSVRVAEYFYLTFTDETVTVGDQSRVIQTPTVHWCKVNGLEVLEEGVIPGKYIPLVPVLGQELQPFDDQRRFYGVIARAKDAQRLLNIEVSSAVGKDALATKVPWLVAEGQEEGHEHEFELSTVRNLSMIRYKPTSLNGQPIEPPRRMLESPDLSSSLLLIQQANEYIQATTFTYDPSLGKQSRGNKPAKAILAEQQQSDAGNSNYMDNLARAMRHEARIVLGMIPTYYDRPGRIVRTVDGEENEQAVMLNAPFVREPETGRPMPAPPGGQTQAPQGKTPPKVLEYDLTKGVYGVSVSIGKSQRSRLEAGSDALGQIIQADPALMPILGPTWLGFQDFPGHQEAADLLKRMQPPQLQNKDEGEESPEQLQAKIQQMGQMLEQAKQEMDGMRQASETKQVEQQGKMAAVQASEQGKAQIEQMRAEFELAKQAQQAQIDAMLAKLDGSIKMRLQDDQQAHEMALAAANADQSQADARMAAEHEALMGERSHEQGLESGEVAHEQAETSAERAAERETSAQGDGAGE